MNPNVQAVLRTTELLNDAAIRSDAEAFAALIAPDFVATDPGNAIRRKEELVSAVASGRLSYTAIHTEIDFADDLGDGLAVVMGTESTRQSSVPAAGDLSGIAIAGQLRRRFTNVYRQENGRWLLLIKQSTIVSVD